jgi:hypothetical protein
MYSTQSGSPYVQMGTCEVDFNYYGVRLLKCSRRNERSMPVWVLSTMQRPKAPNHQWDLSITSSSAGCCTGDPPSESLCRRIEGLRSQVPPDSTGSCSEGLPSRSLRSCTENLPSQSPPHLGRFLHRNHSSWNIDKREAVSGMRDAQCCTLRAGSNLNPGPHRLTQSVPIALRGS